MKRLSTRHLKQTSVALIAATSVVLAGTAPVFAEERAGIRSTPSNTNALSSAAIAQATRALPGTITLRATASQAVGSPAAPTKAKRSVARRVAYISIGAVGGFFAGAFLGAAIEGDRCNCDDPGLLGAVIGAPVGAATGGILMSFLK